MNSRNYIDNPAICFCEGASIINFQFDNAGDDILVLQSCENTEDYLTVFEEFVLRQHLRIK
jgi:hypothetical protein